MASVRRVIAAVTQEIWAFSGAVIDPGIVKILAGWIAEDPPHETQNWWQLRMDQFAQHLDAKGVGDWNTAVAYEEDGYTRGSDGVLYQAVQDNTAIDPIADAGLNWTNAILEASSMAQTGYVTLKTRPALTIQWGRRLAGLNSNSVAFVTLPVAYSVGHFMAQAATSEDAVDNVGFVHGIPFSLTAIKLINAGDSGAGSSSSQCWISIGV